MMGSPVPGRRTIPFPSRRLRSLFFHGNPPLDHDGLLDDFDGLNLLLVVPRVFILAFSGSDIPVDFIEPAFVLEDALVANGPTSMIDDLPLNAVTR
ncbi:MAG: hypothetical protein C4521_07665 [Actinobacteria bacterium]|nr:MAG: hypothetical protein C4521_07665 [Actinomycetota bacterium]